MSDADPEFAAPVVYVPPVYSGGFSLVAGVLDWLKVRQGYRTFREWAM